MSRELRFPAEPVGQVYLMVPDQRPEPQDAAGTIEVPAGAKAFLLLSEPVDLGFTADLDDDVLAGLQAASLDSSALDALSRQHNLEQLSVGEGMSDADLEKVSKLTALKSVDITLAGPAGAGLASLAAVELAALRLHGDPGDALKTIASMGSLSQLHFHTEQLTADVLGCLTGAAALKYLDIEVAEAIEVLDDALLAAMVELGGRLDSLGVTLDGGESGLSPQAMVTLLRNAPGMALNGTEYTPAGIERMARKSGLV